MECHEQVVQNISRSFEVHCFCTLLPISAVRVPLFISTPAHGNCEKRAVTVSQDFSEGRSRVVLSATSQSSEKTPL